MKQSHDTFRRWTSRLAATTVMGLMLGVSAAEAQWLQRTTMKFDRPVVVPNATLEPGTYTFEMMDMKPTLHTIRITNADESKTFAIAQAIPAKRREIDGTTVLRFAAAEGSDAPVALTAWFYPGTRYGHEFLFPEEQAKNIAQTSKSIVLSEAAAPDDKARGAVVVIDSSGGSKPWQGDAETTREWDEYHKKQGMNRPGDTDNR